MRPSLQTKASVFVTLIIVIISGFSTYLFTSAHSRSGEKSLIARGEALGYSLSRAAEEGLAEEDLNILKKASYVIQAPDATLVQVFSSLWQSIDTFPLDRFQEPPLPEAVAHFKTETIPVHYAVNEGYDFYGPILFKAFGDAPPVTIGYVRVILSSADMRKELQRIVAINVTVAALITLAAILSINILIRRIVIKPVLALHRSVSSFRKGSEHVALSLPPRSAPEIAELSEEFTHMLASVREKEAQLMESDSRIRSLFDRVEHAVFRLEANGLIVEANNRFRNLFGPVTELCDILIGEWNAAACLTKAASEKVLHLEDRAVDRDGSEILVSLTLYPEKDANGSVTGFDGYLIDITEKKRLEERLMRAQKLESIGTLAGGIAHDFNNVLAGILGYSDMIVRHSKDIEPIHKYATIIRQAAEQGADLTKKILTISRKEKLEAKPVDLNGVIRSSFELFQRSMPKDIEIVLNLWKDLPLINADPSQLQQVIINLAVNARDAMPAGGRLSIETSPVASGDGAGGRFAAEASELIRLSVADTGTGIDTETRAKIFDPFFTTKEGGKGTGLGLYIVHSIISNHGGYINLYSEPGKGTRFSIYLPAAKGSAAAVLPEPADVRGSGTILVIDDEPNVRELCKDMLSSLGYDVLAADTGAAGVSIYREKKSAVSLVILDMVMPGMGGSETFQALRTIDPLARVLLYSGYSHNNFAGINDLLKRGAAGFIQKPFSGQEIGLAIKNALAKEH